MLLAHCNWLIRSFWFHIYEIILWWFLQSYMLMALVRKQLTFCIPTCLVESRLKVKVNRVFSDWLLLYSGVPLGSLLGPLLFNGFIKNVNFSVQLSSMRLYTNDITTYMHPIPIFQFWNCLLTKVLRIFHPSLPQITFPWMARKPKQWSWVSTIKNLLFILTTPLSKKMASCLFLCSYWH